VTPPKASPTAFVVVHVLQTLQQVPATGAYSAARAVIGAARTVRRRSMALLYAALDPLPEGEDVAERVLHTDLPHPPRTLDRLVEKIGPATLELSV